MPIISISRGSHSGGARLAQALGERLGYRVLSQEVVTEAAARYGISGDEILRGIDMPANVFERFSRSKDRYVLAMQATLGEMFEDGNGIYHGLAGQFLFHDLCNVFKVRLIAPMDYRVRASMAAIGMSRDDALRYIREVDERRAKWGRQVFGIDWNDPDLYDLVVNLEQMDIGTAADAVAELMNRRENQPTPRCVQEFRNFALEKRVKAELYFKSSYNADTIQIRAADGKVFLSGGRSFQQARTGILEFVAALRGVTAVADDDHPTAGVDATLDVDIGVSTRDTTARDVMLPPLSYPHVHAWVSIREAIVAVSASAVRLADGYIMVPRYVLVLDEDDQLVGIVSRRELLKGLVPAIRRASESAAHIRELVPFGGEMPAELMISWTSLFSRTTLEAAKDPVRSIMAEVKGTVQVNDSLSTVISTMLHHGVDLVPVLDGKKVAGVVLMTNIFDIVAQFVVEHGGRAQ